VIAAGQVARLRDDGSVAVRDGVDVRRLLSWTSGRLVFDGTPVPEVLAELSRWFDRDFVLGDSTLAGLKLTTVLGGQSLAEAVAVLETALDVRTRIESRRIILIPS
jgi:transmembrane sensor